MKVFFANEQIDKAVARLENTTPFKQPEMASWLKYNWTVDLPQADYSTLGKALSERENTDPLLGITKGSNSASNLELRLIRSRSRRSRTGGLCWRVGTRRL